ncbi:HrpE/YscL family type III secretion apparatus protein [Deltaproteobacteria bacterium Smac51]|nr:HrpE/YscL family type III secretion apparatus protein [Deltaproteobacteria bacterium Smac51]
MAAVFRLIPGQLSPKAGQKVIKADEAAVYLETSRLMEAWKEREAELIGAAEAEAEALKEKGYQDGLTEGRMEYAEKIMETVIKSVEFIEGLESSVVNIVSEAVRKVIGEMDDREVIVRVVRQALTAVRNEKRIVIRVSAGDEKAVRENLAGVLGRGEHSFMELVPDPLLRQGQCVLESEMGVIEASLETQLQLLEKALCRKVMSQSE